MAVETVSEYADSLFQGEDDILREMRAEAEREGLPSIQVSPELGRLLQLTVLVSGARHILEIGALFGYSAVLMARNLPSDGRIVTLEVSEKHAEITRRNLERAGVGDKVEVRQGDATALLGELSGEFDLVFIDADKESYPVYLDAALRLTHPGSIIIADNVWRGGAVVNPQDETTRAMATFNRRVAEDPRLVSTIIPHRDCGDAATLSVVRA